MSEPRTTCVIDLNSDLGEGFGIWATGRRRCPARDRPVLPWLEQAVIDASAAALVCEAFETESVGGELTGMCRIGVSTVRCGSANCGR